MEIPKSGTFFFECSNSRCGLRLPLDTELYDGRYCPRCGAPLERREAGILAQKPPAGPTPSFRIIGALDNIRSAHNVGAIFRTADGAGLSELLLGGITPTPTEQPAIGKTALGAENSVTWSYHPNLPKTLAELKAFSWLILALECAPGAVSSGNCKLTTHRPDKLFWWQVTNPPGSIPPSCGLQTKCSTSP